MTAPDQALIAAMANAPATPGIGTDNTIRVGTVASNSPSLTVSLQGGTVVSPGYDACFLAEVGSNVALIRQDNTWAVLGKVDPASRPSYYARQRLTADGLVTFSGIPTTLRRVKLAWQARTTYGGFKAEAIYFRIGGDANTFYTWESLSGNGAVVAATSSGGVGGTAGFIGIITTTNAAGGFNFSSGVVEWSVWERPSTNNANSLSCVWQSYACASIVAADQWHNTGGTLYFGGAVYNSIALVTEHGALFQAGSDFQVEGWGD